MGIIELEAEEWKSKMRRPRVQSEHETPDPALLNTLEDARNFADSIVILEGSGRHIYVTCPAMLVGCWEPVLKLLLRDLHAIARPGTAEGARLRYERLEVGHKMAGGGQVVAGVWVHSYFTELGLQRVIRGVLKGKLGRIPAGERLKHAVRNRLMGSAGAPGRKVSR